MADFKQQGRIGELKAPGGLSKLVIKRLHATEAISELFQFNVEAISPDEGNVNLGEALGKDTTVIVQSYGGAKRYFTGTLTDAEHMETTDNGQFGYHLVLRPWLYLCSKRINSRAFQNATIREAIEQIATDAGRTIEFHLDKSYPKLEYIVQHRESDLDFMLRLMEAHGISYHFTFADGSYQMVATDHERKDLPGGADRKLIPPQGDPLRTEEHLSSWLPQRHFVAAKTKTHDYNLETPTVDLYGRGEAGVDFTPKLEHYEELYNKAMLKDTEQSAGNAFATVLLNMHQSEDKRAVADGDAVMLTPGFNMKLTESDDFAGKYLIVRCMHRLEAQDYESGGATEANYSGTYEFLDSGQDFAPPMVTPKPVIAGVQTGKVVAELSSSSEIDVDKYGRIKVHMHWNTADETALAGQTMRCRVLQAWAGTDWGTMFIPRRGMEVLVQYIDGDPDRPVVIGCVYNDTNKPPYELPGGANKNITGWKSRSTEKGGPDDYNEFILDDTKGKEMVRLHAQKDLITEVEHDEKRSIDNDRTTTIKNNETLTIQNDRTTTITDNDTLTVNNEIKVTATSKITFTVGQSSITMEPGTITIASPEIKTTATAMATHDGGGMMTIKAGVVMIN